MAHGHAAEAEHKHHVVPLRTYVMVWVGLLILTYLTVRVSYYDFGEGNLIIAMVIATMKASLVVLFFMALKYDERFNAVVFLGSLGFLSIFLILTLADTMERGKVDPLEARELQLVPARPELMKLAGEGGTDAGTLHLPGAQTGTPAAADSAAADSAATEAPAETGTSAPPGGH